MSLGQDVRLQGLGHFPDCSLSLMLMSEDVLCQFPVLLAWGSLMPG